MDRVLQERKQELQQRIWNLDTFLEDAFDTDAPVPTKAEYKRLFNEYKHRRDVLVWELQQFANALYNVQK